MNPSNTRRSWTVAIALAVGALSPLAQQDKFGAFDSETGGLSAPADAAWNAEGLFHVLEADRDRISILDPEGHPVGAIGTSGDGPGEFHDPRALEFGPDGRLYVADTGNNRIQVFSARRHEFLLAFGSFGAGRGSLSRPTGLAVTETEIFVADSMNNRVQVFDLDGRSLRSFGSRGNGPGEFSRPSDVAVDDEGNAFVTDAWNHRVQKFDASGTHVKSWGDFGPHPEFFATPMGITHHAGELFVADRDNHRIQVFDTDGALLYTWGLHAIRPRESAGKLHYPNRVAISTSNQGTADGAFAAVIESFEDRVQFFGLTADGAEPPAAGSLDRAVSVHYGGTVDSAGGWMTLVEPTRPGAAIWDDATRIAELEPIQISRIWAWGTGFGQFRMPTDAAVDTSRSLLYICDPANLRLGAWRIDRDEGPIKNQPDLLGLAFSIDLAKLETAFDHPGPIEATALELGPGGVIEDSILVADATQRAVIEIGTAEDPEGDEPMLAGWHRWPSAGQEPLLEASDIALSPAGDLLYVADRIAGRVRVFPRTTTDPELTPFEFRGPDEDPLVRPAGICVDDAGFVYVTDVARHRICKFDARGRRLATWGEQGLGRLEFFKPRGIAVREDGNLVVLDHGNHRAQILSPDGEFLHVFGSLLFIRPARR